MARATASAPPPASKPTRIRMSFSRPCATSWPWARAGTIIGLAKTPELRNARRFIRAAPLDRTKDRKRVADWSQGSNRFVAAVQMISSPGFPHRWEACEAAGIELRRRFPAFRARDCGIPKNNFGNSGGWLESPVDHALSAIPHEFREFATHCHPERSRA